MREERREGRLEGGVGGRGIGGWEGEEDGGEERERENRNEYPTGRIGRRV